jgi:hypothetical protein
MKVHRLISLLLATIALVAALVPIGSASATGRDSDKVTARLGISAGAAIQDVPLGTTGLRLRREIPILYRVADRLDIEIRTVSVGFGFFSDGGQLFSEHDLDLVVRGEEDDIELMAAILGKAWEQSVVFIWYPERRGDQATATLPLPGGANQLTPRIYELLVAGTNAPLSDGGHVRYFGRESLFFIANVADRPEDEFRRRMRRAREILLENKIPVGRIDFGRADFTSISSDQYDAIIREGCEELRACA